MPAIDFDQVLEPALVGVNRAWVFMGLGINDSQDPALTEYRLPGAAQIDLVPHLAPEKLAEVKQEFGLWIVANGLRELIETWDVFLDRLYMVALSAEQWSANCEGIAAVPRAHQKRAASFPKSGTATKLRRLEVEFRISLEFQPEIESIKKARNCLTHRLGIVGREDVNHPDGLQVKWRAPELFGYESDGSEFVPSLDSLPIEFPVGSPVMHRHGQRERIVALGDRLQLTPAQLKEICYTFRVAIMQAQDAFAEFIRRIGGRVNEPTAKKSISPQ